MRVGCGTVAGSGGTRVGQARFSHNYAPRGRNLGHTPHTLDFDENSQLGHLARHPGPHAHANAVTHEHTPVAVPARGPGERKVVGEDFGATVHHNAVHAHGFERSSAPPLSTVDELVEHGQQEKRATAGDQNERGAGGGGGGEWQVGKSVRGAGLGNLMWLCVLLGIGDVFVRPWVGVRPGPG